ncbi:MAG: Type III restriction enzyme, res subunit [Pelotomaculum sp. PtaB.Bin104]|nr:MAG: Type III restriction enzyme, res subunit [Pelotomaculum sp. PtaB.Bin104]
MPEKRIKQLEDLQVQLQKALDDCAWLREENARLKMLLNLPVEKEKHLALSINLEPGVQVAAVTGAITSNSPVESKIAFFRSLFKGREDVYPVRWEGKDGKFGYSPACANEWKRKVCRKPVVKCAGCEQRKLLSVTDQVIHDHLAGKRTIGVYPLLHDETCWFIAADFDKKTWQEDSAAFLATCGEMGISAALERSRSGNGGHIWIFFSSPVAASLARKLGSTILTRTMERRHQIGFDSYDRFFPNQDTMPKGGFGNLIALPLQRIPRNSGNSLFLDQDFKPHEDQWLFLSTLKKVEAGEAEAIVHKVKRTGSIIGIRKSVIDGQEDEEPWILPPSGKIVDTPILGPIPEKVRIVQSNMIFIEKHSLPPAMINRLVRIAALQNPEFYKAQAMRLPTFGKPRVIACAEDYPRYIGLPRGCLDEVLEMMTEYKINVELEDERFVGNPIDVIFKGELNPLQQAAATALLSNENGILSATTAFGKTVVAAWLIAARKVNTLVLVHRRQLMDQWQERLAAFLDVPPKSIGQVGGGKDKRTGIIDIGIIQSLRRKSGVKDLVAEYGQVIVDECHHLSAFSFEQVLKQVRARYVCGLTATPVRKDGHHPIIMMQCGPIRFWVDAKKLAASRPFECIIIPRCTNFGMSSETSNPGIQEIYAALIVDENRNDIIFDDLLLALEAGRSPLMLTERTEHVDYFAKRLKGFARNVIALRGGMGKKQRKAIADQIASIPDNEERVLISTGRYIGEGFDDARLDTLFLIMPISWRGTLQQYAGRLHRLHDHKRIVQIYDYVDVNVPMLMRMYEKRLKGYNAIGYRVQEKIRYEAGEEE